MTNHTGALFLGTESIELVREALAEDVREKGQFHGANFDAFFPEEEPAVVREAWLIYDQIVNGCADRKQFGL